MPVNISSSSSTFKTEDVSITNPLSPACGAYVEGNCTSFSETSVTLRWRGGTRLNGNTGMGKTTVKTQRLGYTLNDSTIYKLNDSSSNTLFIYCDTEYYDQTWERTTSAQTIRLFFYWSYTSDSGTDRSAYAYVDVVIPALSTYTIEYDANDGSDAPSSQTKTYGTDLTLSSTKPTRTGYTFLGWSTSKNATSATYSAGGKYTANADTTLYAVWSEHYLEINYYSNYATSAFDGDSSTVGADKNVRVATSNYYYDNDYSTNGLKNYSTFGGDAYMTRTRYDATGYWCTTTAEDIKLEGNKTNKITYNGGIAVGEDMSFSSGQDIAEAFNLSLENGNESINLYAHWVLLASRITVYDENGKAHRGLCHIRGDDGVIHYAILTVYDSEGNAHTVV